MAVIQLLKKCVFVKRTHTFNTICTRQWWINTYAVLVVLERQDTADWRRNNNQLETDVAECRGTWTSWGAVAADHSRLCITMMMMLSQMTRMPISSSNHTVFLCDMLWISCQSQPYKICTSFHYWMFVWSHQVDDFQDYLLKLWPDYHGHDTHCYTV